MPNDADVDAVSRTYGVWHPVFCVLVVGYVALQPDADFYVSQSQQPPALFAGGGFP